MTPMTTDAVQTRPWTRKEYDRLIELGVLGEDERVELIGGQLSVAEPKGSPYEPEPVSPLALPAATITVDDLLP